MKNPSNPVHLPLQKSQRRMSIMNININCRYVFRTHSKPASNCVLLAKRYFFQALPKLHPPQPQGTLLPYLPIIMLNFVLYLPLYSSAYIPQLHFIQHGIFSQPGEESLFTEESRSPPWESTCTCIAEDRQSSLPIKCLNFSPNLPV
jgi:hypothetical protein